MPSLPTNHQQLAQLAEFAEEDVYAYQPSGHAAAQNEDPAIANASTFVGSRLDCR